VLVIAIENQLGLKYFAGAPEDHLGKPFLGIENQYTLKGPVTFGKKEIKKRLLNSGFKGIEFLYPFPDYKFPQATLTHNGTLDETINAQDILKNKTKYFQNEVYNSSFSEEKVWPSIIKNKLVGDLANSFLIVASGDDKKRIASEALAYTFSTSYRTKPFCKINKFVWTDNSYFVIKERCFPFDSNPSLFVQQHLTDEKYNVGSLFINELEALLSKDDWTIQAIQAWAKPWIKHLITLSKKEKSSGNLLINGIYFDATPFNLILTNNNKDFNFFDLEWEIKEDCRLDFILFRALYYSLQSITQFSKSKLNSYIFISDIVIDVLKQFFTENQISIGTYEKKENQILNEIQNSEHTIHFNKKIDYYSNEITPTNRPFLDPLARVNLQFFWSAERAEFLENLSSWETIDLSTEEIGQAQFILPANKTELKAFRFDVGNATGLINIHEIRVVNPEGNVLWTWDKQINQLNDALLLENELVWPGKLVHIAISEDPQIVINVEEELKNCIANAEVIEIVISAVNNNQLQLLRSHPSKLHYASSTSIENEVPSKIDDVLKIVSSLREEGINLINDQKQQLSSIQNELITTNQEKNNYEILLATYKEKMLEQESKLAKTVVDYDTRIIKLKEELKKEGEENVSQKVLINGLKEKNQTQEELFNKINTDAVKQIEVLQQERTQLAVSQQEQRSTIVSYQEKLQLQETLTSTLKNQFELEKEKVLELNQEISDHTTKLNESSNSYLILEAKANSVINEKNVLEEKLRVIENSLAENFNQKEELIKSINLHLNYIEQVNIERKEISEVNTGLLNQLAKIKASEQQLELKLVELNTKQLESQHTIHALQEENLKYKNQNTIDFIKTKIYRGKTNN